jgi:predicted membrane-bound spermidine synthase
MPLTKTAVIDAAGADVATTAVADLPGADAVTTVVADPPVAEVGNVMTVVVDLPAAAGNAARVPIVVEIALAATVTKATAAAAATATTARAKNRLPRACSLRWSLPDPPSMD